MILLTFFAFLGGVVTILSPCILPILPIVLSGSLTGGKKRPLGVVTGFVVSFTFFTLFLSLLVKLLGIPADSLRNFSIGIIFIFGLSFLVPRFQMYLEKLFALLSVLTPKSADSSGFWGGIVIGLSIGLLWTPCVGPILAAIISLAITGTVNGQAAIITFSYALGTAIPMLGIVWGGRNLLNRVPWLLNNTMKIQKGFGVLMMLTAVAIYLNFDRSFQVWILNKFPYYGVSLTKFEDNQIVKNALERLKGDQNGGQFEASEDMGKPLFQVSNGFPTAPEIREGGYWYNLASGMERLRIGEQRGKVILIDFWTYTCINCIRTLPYLRDWHDKYADQGLVIIGVHTPEFEFEKDPKNVQKAIDDFGIKYPVMQDNDYATWRAYNNRYWPAKYLIDKNGMIRYTHFGEGKYDETEKTIQSLLEETGRDVSDVDINYSSYKVEAKTPETYLGYARLANMANINQLEKNQLKEYTTSKALNLNDFALWGKWQVAEEYSRPESGSKLFFRFEAKEVFLVMRPRSVDTPGNVKVTIDVFDAKYLGEDVKSDGVVKVDSDRLYSLIRLNQAGYHLLEIEFLDDDVEIYAFTFG